MPLYPINLNIRSQRCAVLGGGRVATRKVAALLAAEAAVTVISPQLTRTLAELVANRRIVYWDRPYRTGDLAGFWLVICATGDPAVNRAAAREVITGGGLVNVADDPAAGNFSVPAQVQRGDLLFTVSTGGKSPALARELRRELAARYGPEYARYLESVAKLRGELKTDQASPARRCRFWRRAIDDEVLILLRQGELAKAEARIKDAVDSNRSEP